MRLLLDTHALLWWLANDPALSEEAGAAIANPASVVFVSAATAWEMAIKQALGKLQAPSDLERQLELNRFEPLSITVGHAYAAGTLPRHHDDPFDRMLVAQALTEQLTVITKDARIGSYGVATLPAVAGRPEVIQAAGRAGSGVNLRL
ncbi:MAG: type II toxin-antitoxin system VapC family toxin [Actinobacteria bacterium]|nr:type II toxin-antitoxin system VapC family toxin [Actinomycetota bacterium]